MTMIRVSPKTAHDWALDAARTADKLAQELERGAVCARQDGERTTEAQLRLLVLQARLLRRQLLDGIAAA